jgi:dethiobiotin synthetase
MNHLLITSVGTEIGKTLVSSILCHQLIAQGRHVNALKPVVSGFSSDDAGSDPVLLLRSLDRQPTPAAITSISPWRFSAPVSPHLAARREGRNFALQEIIAFCRRHEDAGRVLLIEGAGGVMSPLTDHATNLELIVALHYPVVLVTGTYLGALSHTLTAHQVLARSGVKIQAIIVSESESTAGLADTVGTLEQFINPRLPIIPLQRLAGSHDQKCRSAPDLIGTIILNDSGL